MFSQKLMHGHVRDQYSNAMHSQESITQAVWLSMVCLPKTQAGRCIEYLPKEKFIAMWSTWGVGKG